MVPPITFLSKNPLQYVLCRLESDFNIVPDHDRKSCHFPLPFSDTILFRQYYGRLVLLYYGKHAQRPAIQPMGMDGILPSISHTHVFHPFICRHAIRYTIGRLLRSLDDWFGCRMHHIERSMQMGHHIRQTNGRTLSSDSHALIYSPRYHGDWREFTDYLSVPLDLPDVFQSAPIRPPLLQRQTSVGILHPVLHLHRCRTIHDL